MGEKCDDVISQLNKVSKSCTDFFLKCDLLQSIRLLSGSNVCTHVAQSSGAVVCSICSSSGLCRSLTEQQCSYHPESFPTDLVWSWSFTFLCNYTISLNQRGNGCKLSPCCCHQISEPRAFSETLCPLPTVTSQRYILIQCVNKPAA